MAKGHGKKGLITTIIVLGVTLLVVGGLVLWQNMNHQATTVTKANDTPAVDTGSAATTNSSTTTATATDTTTPSEVDPSTLSSIDIEPLNSTVFYTKGTPGFEYAVKRASDGTQYVEFSSPSLVGTKCTNDSGLFATIIKNPTSTEDKSTISKTTTVDGVAYGLSLAGSTCTKDTDLLQTYQTAFSNGFSQLKEMQ